MRSLAAAVIAITGCASMPPPKTMTTTPSTLAPDRQVALKTLLDKAEQDKAYPAIAVGLATTDGLVWSGAGGVVDDASQRPVDADTVFRIGSLTKLFSSAAILTLRDAGKLDLDDPVEKTIPEMRGVVYPEGPHPAITIRMLLTHRSGFPRLGRVDYTRGTHDISEGELLGELSGLKLESTPGTKASYSNLAMALTGVLIQRVSGERYRDYVTKHLFVPLGMTSLFWSRDDVPPGRLATGHQRVRGSYVVGPAHWRLGAMEAMGGIYSSMNDLARFAKFALAAWTDGEDGGPLKKATRREWMTATTATKEGEPAFAFNWLVGNAPGIGRIVGHTGSTADYSASIIASPERHLAGLVLLATGEAEDADHLAAELVLASLGPAPAPTPSTKTASEVHLAELKPLLLTLFRTAPTKETIETIFAPSKKSVEERLAFYQTIHQQNGDCTAVDDGVPSDTQGGTGVFRVTCERIRLEVTAHFANGKIDWILVRPADR